MIDRDRARKGAEWWANAMRSPKFDDGDPSETGVMAMLMATVAAGDPPGEEKFQEFAKELENRIVEDNPRSIGVVHGPDIIIGESMQKAGISLDRAPWKTTMIFGDDDVRVAHGYGADFETL